MATTQQLFRSGKRVKGRVYDRRWRLGYRPQRAAICRKVYTMKPRKPNSALRRVARVMISRPDFYHVTAFVPGVTSNLTKHCNVLIRGGRTRDLPGLQYKVIRGVRDLQPLFNRTHGRSKFGVPWRTGDQLHGQYRRYRLW